MPSSEMETPRDHGEFEVYEDIREGGRTHQPRDPGMAAQTYHQTPATPHSPPTCLSHTHSSNQFGGDKLSVGLSRQLLRKGEGESGAGKSTSCSGSLSAREALRRRYREGPSCMTLAGNSPFLSPEPPQ